MMLAHAFRSLRRSPGLAIAAVSCLALGAAATTAVATLVSALLLRPLPFPEADRLVRVWFEEPGGDTRVSLSIPEFDDFKQAKGFDAFLGTARVRVVALFGNGAERLRGEGVSRDYFQLLGLRPHLGRLFAAADHAPSGAPALVVSHGAWTQYFGADPNIVGRELRTARAVYTIIGVSQRGFHGTVEDDIVEFFVPIEHYEPRSLQTNRMGRSAWAIARLAPGTSIEQANAEVAAIGAGLARSYPQIYGSYVARVEPMGESWRAGLRRGGALLFAASAVLLLIAAINVGCLLLARVLDRRRELAIRASLGADRRRVMLQLFAEAVVLVTMGGVVGALAGPWLLDAFLTLSPVTLPHYVDLRPDVWTVLLATATLSLAGVLAGTVRAMIGRRVQPGDVLRESGRGTLGRRTERRWTTALIVGETALTLVLLVGGGLLLRSFDQLSSAELGFDRTGIARLAVTLNSSDVGAPENLPRLYDRLREAVAKVPGVQHVGLVSPTLPPWDGERARVQVQGLDLAADSNGVMVGVHFSDHGLLSMLGTRVVAGRDLQASDGPGAALVAVISSSLADRLGGPERAIGRALRFASNGSRPSDRTYRIVGVADDIAYDGVVEQDTRRFLGIGDHADARASRYDVYFSLAQTPATVVSIGVSTAGDASAMLGPVRQAIASIAPASAVHWISAMDDEIAIEYAPSRFYSVIVTIFSLSALLLTSIGLFALLSHAASQRMSEMGLRLALGATPRATTALLLRTGLLPLAAGVSVGLIAAAITSRAMQGMLYGIEAFDTPTFAASVAALLAVTLSAALIPARRVAKVDPITTLRTD
jgi:putative ABC transport system permease protein